MVHEEDWIAWLTQARAVADMLQPSPAGSFEVVGSRKRVPWSSAAAPVTRDLFDLR